MPRGKLCLPQLMKKCARPTKEDVKLRPVSTQASGGRWRTELILGDSCSSVAPPPLSQTLRISQSPQYERGKVSTQVSMSKVQSHSYPLVEMSFGLTLKHRLLPLSVVAPGLPQKNGQITPPESGVSIDGDEGCGVGARQHSLMERLEGEVCS